MVNGTAHVYIWSKGTNINDELIQKGYGEPCEENFLSKVSSQWSDHHGRYKYFVDNSKFICF